MKFSESWLRTFVNPDMERSALSHLLTMAGLEVEELDPVAPAFTGVLVAQVLSVEKHPDADRLNVCQVDVGDGTTRQIVCGAPNVAAGLKVPCALPGAELPGNFKIKLAKVRGVESGGMLCSAKELGIAEEANGLLILPEDAPVGQSIRDYLLLDDYCFTLKLTPNRADCLSLQGIAREVAAIAAAPLSLPNITPVTVSSTAQRGVVLDAPDACARYCGRVLTGINAAAATPDWMRQRLERSGIRSISAVVDITNYVMLELGQPLHAFDNDKLSGDIHVRWAQAGDSLQLLNEQTITPAADVLLIADAGAPLALAGIMGGEASGVTLNTSNVFLESAFFAPKAIAGRARRYNFSSDASHRFERGVDFAGTLAALERASELILAICGGAAGSVTEAVVQADLPQRTPVRLRRERAVKVLGFAFSTADIASIFTRLGLSFSEADGVFLVTPPSYRFDIQIEEDLIEEIARIHGYDNIPAIAPQAALSMLPQTEKQRPVQALRLALADAGYQEVINFAFVEAAWEQDFANNPDPIRLANPIASQLAVMRSTLLSGLVANLQTNLKRKQSQVRLFELGRCFTKTTSGTPVAGYHQPWVLSGLAYGTALPEQWGDAGRKVDYFDVKGDLENLFAPLAASFVRTQHPALHPGRSSAIYLNGEFVGVLGELHPEWCQKYDLPNPPVVFELQLAALGQANVPAYQEVSRFPAVVRDLAIVLEQNIALADVMAGMHQARSTLVQELSLFDVYVGKGIPENKKSLAFRVVLQDTQRTLQDAEVDAAVQQLIQYLEQNFDAKLRA